MRVSPTLDTRSRSTSIFSLLCFMLQWGLWGRAVHIGSGIRVSCRPHAGKGLLRRVQECRIFGTAACCSAHTCKWTIHFFLSLQRYYGYSLAGR